MPMQLSQFLLASHYLQIPRQWTNLSITSPIMAMSYRGAVGKYRRDFSGGITPKGCSSLKTSIILFSSNIPPLALSFTHEEGAMANNSNPIEYKKLLLFKKLSVSQTQVNEFGTDIHHI